MNRNFHSYHFKRTRSNKLSVETEDKWTGLTIRVFILLKLHHWKVVKLRTRVTLLKFNQNHCTKNEIKAQTFYFFPYSADFNSIGTQRTKFALKGAKATAFWIKL